LANVNLNHLGAGAIAGILDGKRHAQVRCDRFDRKSGEFKRRVGESMAKWEEGLDPSCIKPPIITILLL
jgi:hypothetical protein